MVNYSGAELVTLPDKMPPADVVSVADDPGYPSHRQAVFDAMAEQDFNGNGIAFYRATCGNGKLVLEGWVRR